MSYSSSICFYFKTGNIHNQRIITVFSEKEREDKHCCKNCIKKHISCPIAGDVAEYAVSCIHKMISTDGDNYEK